MKPEELKASLHSYVKQHKVRGKCAFCQLDVRPLIDDEVRAGANITVVRRWLNSEGGHPEVTDAQMRHHFRNRHHEQG